MITTIVSAKYTRSWEMRTSPSVQAPLGRIGSARTPVGPTRIWNTAVRTSITPIDATALASGGADRAGRNTRRYSSNPVRVHTATEINAAGQKPITTGISMRSGTHGRGIITSPCRRNAYVYAPSSAIVPVAKLTTPLLR